MKTIEELGEMDVIHCPTFEEWTAILKLNPRNDVSDEAWHDFSIKTFYRPSGDRGKGTYDELYYTKGRGYTIHKASEFLQPELPSNETSFIQEPKLLKDTDLGYFTGCLIAGGINPQLAVSHAKNIIAELRKEVLNG